MAQEQKCGSGWQPGSAMHHDVVFQGLRGATLFLKQSVRAPGVVPKNRTTHPSATRGALQEDRGDGREVAGTNEPASLRNRDCGRTDGLSEERLGGRRNDPVSTSQAQLGHHQDDAFTVQQLEPAQRRADEPAREGSSERR